MQSIPNKDQYLENEKYSCNDLLIKLIKASDYNADAKALNFKVRIENEQDSIVTLQLTI